MKAREKHFITSWFEERMLHSQYEAIQNFIDYAIKTNVDISYAKYLAKLVKLNQDKIGNTDRLNKYILDKNLSNI